MQVSCVAESAQRSQLLAFQHLMHPLVGCLLSCLQWELLRYDDPNQELAGTDLQALEGRPAPTPAAEGEQLQAQR